MAHWYSKEGETAYEVMGTNGKMRDTTLRDAKKYGYSPSVTTILGIVNKEALNIWKMNQLFDAMVASPPKKFKDDGAKASYKRMVMAESARKGREAADRGTEIHDALDKYIKDGVIVEGMDQFVSPVIQLLLSRFGNVEWIPEMSFTHPDRFGGKCDLHAKPCEAFPNGVILDFKTKATENFKGVKAYQENCLQLVAYRLGFNLPKAECFNLFISTHTTGDMMLHMWKEEDCKKSEVMFYHLLRYWQLNNNLVA